MISFNYVNKKIVFRGGRDSSSKFEILGLFGLFISGLILLGLSWRKWCDPQIDFGREVYIPWRMANGAKWLKDVDDLYGPLSRFIDAGLFKLFGPGIMVLAWANLIVYIAIVSLLYILFKKAWGVTASLVSCAVFIAVFSFSQLTVTSNYNYLAPYSQQVTHGFLVSLLLVWVLAKWIKNPNVKLSFLAGLYWGLTAVLKPEFILAGGLMIGSAFFWCTLNHGLPSIKNMAAAGLGVILPTAIFTLYIATYMPISSAFVAASHAWLNGLLIWKDTLTAHLLNSFSGMDNPKANLLVHAFFTFKVLLLIGMLVVTAWFTAQFTNQTIKQYTFLLICGLVIFFGIKGVSASSVGQCILGLLLLYILYNGLKSWLCGNVEKVNKNLNEKTIVRLLLTVFGLALMTRMLLNGRIYQYGFFQAAPAAMVLCAVLMGEMPDLSLLKPQAKRYYSIFVILFISSGCLAIIIQSERLLIQKTAPVSSGSDLFYYYPGNVQGMGEIVRSFSETLAKRPDNETVAVVPEGIMINYLSRKVSPVKDILFYGNPMMESNMLSGLRNSSPDWVVLISRDLSEYGVIRYGDKTQSGEAILSWIKTNYHAVLSFGADPLSPKSIGGIIYQHNTMPAHN
jgi:hypothetical protein